ncbi:nuclear transport factor 2 family protein [Phaeobacter inhibens]|uniref:nuclear transport factor 2 family protein n=1 Tax=Phaeobacter inhibens TaxID=221822 RepID=UPI000C9CA7E4|nr:nuclear transport factor 2 family protein [Phaeobacter inhibens]AUQ54026.1 Domain protein of unknown function [Phaeobacter inhibens]AUQ78042.1 Domain protein of unknown function [Phaeobacter inhibens]AUR15201.1 Domain protein of unknown function [Phaeobacter inhibens]
MNTEMQVETTKTKTLLRELLAAETAVWTALQQGDIAADRAALHPQFLGVYPSGFAGRDDHTEQLEQGPTVAEFSIADARVLPLGPETALLAYRATYTRPGQTEGEVKGAAMYVSSIWQRQDGGWINIFSQDTEALPEGATNPLP